MARTHIALFTMIALSTHCRIEALLELDTTQIIDGLIFNAPGRAQTKKRRAVVPIAPTLAPWLEDLPEGKVIQWKKPRIDRKTGDMTYTREPAASVKNAFESCPLAAGLRELEVDENGEPIWLPPRKRLGGTKPRLSYVGLGSPNALRHTCATQMHRLGVPEAQIESAAGHRGSGTNAKHYRHLRPDYLAEFIAGVERFWTEVGEHTDAHLRYHRDTKIVDLKAIRSGRAGKVQ